MFKCSYSFCLLPINVGSVYHISICFSSLFIYFIVGAICSFYKPLINSFLCTFPCRIGRINRKHNKYGKR